MNQIPLRGCAPEPLIHYLKALGILRLVAEQLDPQARAAWHGDTFMLETEKTKEDLVDFFLNRYCPTPIVAPWNGGSGFYDGDDTSGIDAILSSQSARLKEYRDAIEHIFSFPELPSVSYLTLQDLLGRIEQAIEAAPNKDSKDVKDWKKVAAATNSSLDALKERFDLNIKTIQKIEELKNQQTEKYTVREISNLLQPAKKLRTIVKKFERSSGKDIIIQACRNQLTDQCVEWIDATVVLSDKDAESPLLGSGGNDGRLDFTKAFMLYLKEALPNAMENADASATQSETRVRASLFADTVATVKTEIVGQFFPAGAGGANASEGVSGKPNINPWDFVLGIEGCLVLASATVRQLVAGARTKASFPFTVKSSKVGYGTAAEDEDVKAEIWLPLWSRFTRYAEVAHIFKEGRVQFINQKRSVQTGFDFARAVAELGVDRGVESFQRYAFSKRFGKNYFAISLGAFEVRERPLVALIHQLDRGRWLDSFIRASSDEKKTPPRFVRARKRIEEAIFKLCATGNVAHLRETLITLGAAEAELSDGERFREESKKKKNIELRPLTGLSLRWVSECNDGSDEFRIASALAAMRGEGKVGSFRSNLESFDDAARSWAQRSTSAVWSNAGLEENLASVLQRRSIDARSQSLSHPPISSSRLASLTSVNAFLNRETDDEKLEDLLRGLVLIDWSQDKTPESKIEKRNIPPTLSRAYALLKLLFLPKGEFQPKPNAETIVIKHEPSIVPLLRAGRVPDALDTAARRLRASGVMPLTTDFYLREEDGARLAAALLIPIDEPSIREIARLVLHDEAED